VRSAINSFIVDMGITFEAIGKPRPWPRLASGSASMARTLMPRRANHFARKAERVVFPTPPLPLTAIFNLPSPSSPPLNPSPPSSLQASHLEEVDGEFMWKDLKLPTDGSSQFLSTCRPACRSRLQCPPQAGSGGWMYGRESSPREQFLIALPKDDLYGDARQHPEAHPHVPILHGSPSQVTGTCSVQFCVPPKGRQERISSAPLEASK